MSDNTTIILRFYADKKPEYINKYFSFRVKRSWEKLSYLEAERIARNTLQSFWDNANEIRAAFLAVDGVSNRFCDTQLIKKTKQGKPYIEYIFHWENYTKHRFNPDKKRLTKRNSR